MKNATATFTSAKPMSATIAPTAVAGGVTAVARIEGGVLLQLHLDEAQLRVDEPHHVVPQPAKERRQVLKLRLRLDGRGHARRLPLNLGHRYTPLSVKAEVRTMNRVNFASSSSLRLPTYVHRSSF